MRPSKSCILQNQRVQDTASVSLTASNFKRGKDINSDEFGAR